MADTRRTLVAWLALLVTLSTYAVMAGQSIATQGQRITTIERRMEEDQADRREIVDKLNAISDSLTGLRAEQRILHGLPADVQPVQNAGTHGRGVRVLSKR